MSMRMFFFAATTGVEPIEFLEMGTDNDATGGNNATFNFTATLQEGDVVITAVAADNIAGGQDGIPTGYTSLDSNLGSSVHAQCAYKQMGGTPDTSVTIPYLSDGRCNAYHYRIYRNVDKSTPIDATTTSATGDSANPDPASITTTKDGAYVVCFAFCDDDVITGATYPSGYDNGQWVDGGRPAGNNASLVSADKKVETAGAENPGTFAPTGFNDVWRCTTVALRPLPIPIGGGGTPSIRSGAAVDTGSGGTLTLDVPTHSEGDLLVACMGGSFSGGSNWTQASWTEAYDRSGTGGLGVFYKTATGSEPSTYAFSNTNSNNYSGVIIAIQNGAWGQAGSADATDNDTGLAAPSITVGSGAGGDQLLLAVFQNNSSGGIGTPTGMTDVIDYTSNPALLICEEMVSAGATGTRTITSGEGDTAILLEINST